MSTYWVVFFVPAFLALIGNKRERNIWSEYSTKIDLLWLSVMIALTILIGFRFYVGGDWGNYYWQVERATGAPFSEAFALRGDPLFALLNWLSGNLGFGVYGVQIISGLVFSFGLIKLCLTLPRPFLGLTVAIPYLVFVAALGYSRQGLSIGICMYALTLLSKEKKLYFLILILIAASVHKSAIILLPMLGMYSKQNKIITLLWLVGSSAIAFFVFIYSYIEFLVFAYLESEYNSRGALIRLLMGSICGLIFIIFTKKFKMQESEKKIWIFYSYAALILFLAMFVSPGSTALDRIGLYFIPLQLVVLSYLPELFDVKKKISQLLKFLIVSYCTMILMVWLFFSDSAFRWLPYKSFLVEQVDYKKLWFDYKDRRQGEVNFPGIK
jgi:hypothetical protein